MSLTSLPFPGTAAHADGGESHRHAHRAAASAIEQAEHLLRGAAIQPGAEPPVPRMLISGALRLDPVAERAASVLLALPGSLIGLESLRRRPAVYAARAIVACVLAPLPHLDDAAWRDLLMRSLITQQERAAELAELRSGPVPERVRRLLVLLSQGSRGGAGLSPWRAATPSCEQPTLADIAALTDTAEETVSRVLSAMRRQGDLVRDGGRRVRLDPRMFEQGWTLSAAATYAHRGGTAALARPPGPGCFHA
jgi:CRP-like cAMP-binding protein